MGRERETPEVEERRRSNRSRWVPQSFDVHAAVTLCCQDRSAVH